MNKQEEYRKLVEKRKSFKFQDGLTNPSETNYDINQIEPWAQWQNNLDAEILVIGQEFCDLKTFNKCNGKVELFENVYEYPANKNLQHYLSQIGYDPGHPFSPNTKAKLFFTNCVMGLKNGKMSANFSDKWINESRTNFLEPLINIVKPKYIIGIGSKPTLSLSRIFKFKFDSMKNIIEQNAIKVNDVKIFPVYHTGGLGLRNRKKELQNKDWKKIGNSL